MYVVAAVLRITLLSLFPAGPSREFAVGQWIDALDTVNEWLEATVLNLSRDGTEVCSCTPSPSSSI